MSFKSWLMVGGLTLLVILMLLVAKLKTPQDIRQKAAGSECYVAVKDQAGSEPEIIEGAGGRQQIGGVSYCVGGVGNDADRYASFYKSKIEGQTALTSGSYPCAKDQWQQYRIGDRCQVGEASGKVICVGGPEKEYWGCISGDEKKLYRRLGERVVGQPTPIPTSTPEPAQTNLTSWQEVPITLEVTFIPTGALDPTKAEKNFWPWLALFINNGGKLKGAYDQADCSQPQPEAKQTKQKSYFSCGQPNLYLDRLWDNFQVAPETQAEKTQDVVKSWAIPAGDLLKSVGPYSRQMTTKLSFVFYNDYFDGQKKNRQVAIKSLRFLAPDGSELLKLTPEDESFWQRDKLNWSVKQSFYFDLGLVDDTGEKDAFQDGFVAAFDKKKLSDVNDNQSKLRGVWLLDEEGSFNVVVVELDKAVRQWFKKNQN